MSRRIKLVLVGLGKIARDQHIGAIERNEAFRLVGAVDPNAEHQEGFPVFSSVEALLNSGLAFDGVAVCTPPQVRREICEKLIGTGCAILLEKPPASDLAAARSLEISARGSGAILFAAWHSRFSPHIEAAREWVCAHRIIGGSIEWRENPDKWHPGQAWLWQKGGFGVFDPGINALSILTEIFPADWRVLNSSVSLPENAGAPEAADFQLEAAGTTLSVAFEFHRREEEVWNITLSAASGEILELSEGGAVLKVGAHAPIRSPVSEYDGVYRRFEHLIRERKSDYDLAPLAIAERVLAGGLKAPGR